MGCNKSKSADVQKDRNRLHDGHKDADNQHLNQTRTHPVGIHSPAIKDSDVDNIYGKSYTDRRAIEHNFLKDIIEKTQANFIDVSTNRCPLDEVDTSERTKHYTEQMDQLLSTDKTVSSLLDFASQAGMQDAQISKELSDAQQELILNFGNAVVSAISRFQIQDAGSIVVSFADL